MTKIVYIYQVSLFCSRGMRFENVSVLTDNIKDIIKDMRYCWQVSIFCFRVYKCKWH